jgi:membrane-associated protease RseP (regulator of RpoE activity)
MNKTSVLLIAFLLFGTTPTLAHDGKTPFSVLKGMKQQKTGPYASPMMMGNKTLVADWLKISTKDSGDDSRPGVLVVEVTEDGLADEEGLEKGDLIIGINDTPIKTLADLEGFLAGIEHPEVFTFRLLRDDDEEDEEVYLDNNLFEMDDEMADLIMSKRSQGEFKQGMLAEDMMARSPLGSMDKGGGPGYRGA